MEPGRNNLEFSRLMYLRAKGDLETAQILFDNGQWADCVYHSQQCVEKIIKVVLILENKFVEEHIVCEFFEDTLKEKGLMDDEMKKLIAKIKSLEEHWVKPRYPFIAEMEVWNPMNQYTKEMAEKGIQDAKEVFDKIYELLKKNYILGWIGERSR